MVDIKIDPEDGLPAFEVGGWAEDKHDCLRKYLGISTYARRKFLGDERSGASYIELFAGPGRLWNKDSEKFIDGSPLIALAEASRTKTVFTTMHLGDLSQPYLDAVNTRLVARGANVRTYHGRSDKTVDEILEQVNPNAINFAFLDPFNIEGLPFTIMEKFAKVKKMDLLIHVSAMELQRWLDRYMSYSECSLDAFAPGWRKVVDGRKPDVNARAMVLEYWVSLLKRIGFTDAQRFPLIRGPSNTPMYWLVLVAKHDLAAKFWDAINRPKQDSFRF